jgi:hypothetical protein
MMAIYGSDQHVSDESNVASFGPPSVDGTAIKAMAEKACFFVEGGKFLRVDFCEEHFFHCHNEYSGEEYEIEYTEVDLENTYFMELVAIPNKTGDQNKRDAMVERLVADDIDTIAQGITAGDLTFLDSVLRGEGWVPYSALSDKQIETEYREREFPKKALPTPTPSCV